MDINTYIVAKAAGTIKTMQVGPSTAAVGIPTFDPLTGKATTPVLEQFNLQTIDEIIAPLNEKIVALRDQVAAWQQFRADLVGVGLV